jgi:hypothetical protein
LHVLEAVVRGNGHHWLNPLFEPFWREHLWQIGNSIKVRINGQILLQKLVLGFNSPDYLNGLPLQFEKGFKIPVQRWQLVALHAIE